MNGLFEDIVNRKKKIAVVGMGYVGLPLAAAFSKKADVIGFDINENRIRAYAAGKDTTAELGDAELAACPIVFTSDEGKLSEASFYIVAVPTPIRADKTPDLTPVESASRTIGKYLKKGDAVVYESTVYPGVTEDICIPILEEESGLVCPRDFKVGYSPERINPGDRVHRLHNMVKIVSGIDAEALDTIADVYGLIIEAGIYRAENIKVAEAAKVVENAQRDINIAFINEVAMLFDRMGIDTKTVLAANATKWNFLNFYPGLVGGHCIGVDPYYLHYKAESEDFHTRMILTGRQINDDMGKFVARKIVKLLVLAGSDMKKIRVGILGLAYKENCPDTRNTRVVDIICKLAEYGIQSLVYDPFVDKTQVHEEYGITCSDLKEFKDINVFVVAVPHKPFLDLKLEDFIAMAAPKATKIMVDVKGIYDMEAFQEAEFVYWRL